MPTWRALGVLSSPHCHSAGWVGHRGTTPEQIKIDNLIAIELQKHLLHMEFEHNWRLSEEPNWTKSQRMITTLLERRMETLEAESLCPVLEAGCIIINPEQDRVQATEISRNYGLSGDSSSSNPTHVFVYTLPVSLPHPNPFVKFEPVHRTGTERIRVRIQAPE